MTYKKKKKKQLIEDWLFVDKYSVTKCPRMRLTHDSQLQYITLAISFHIGSKACVVAGLRPVQTLQSQVAESFLIAEDHSVLSIVLNGQALRINKNYM